MLSFRCTVAFDAAAVRRRTQTRGERLHSFQQRQTPKGASLVVLLRLYLPGCCTVVTEAHATETANFTLLRYALNKPVVGWVFVLNLFPFSEGKKKKEKKKEVHRGSGSARYIKQLH